MNKPLGQSSLRQSSTFSHLIKKTTLRVTVAALRWEVISLLGKIFAESVRDPVIASWRWSLGRER
jgi:hypothetical protein